MMLTFFYYDNTFEGLLTAVFDAYKLKLFPDRLIAEDDIPPLFAQELFTVVYQEEKYLRVWAALEKKLSKPALNQLNYAWLSEEEGSAELIFRYIRKVIDSPYSIESNFSDHDVLNLNKLAKKVSNEKWFIIELVRFQQTGDNIYFAAIEPIYNALPLAITYFEDRFLDQKWIIYDIKRKYGYYYDLDSISDIGEIHSDCLCDGKLNESLLIKNEKFCQQLWKCYFDRLTIKERINPKLQKQHMPVRFWKYLPEKQR